MSDQYRYPEQYETVEALERYLGSPLDPLNALSFKRAVGLDERDEYPEEACALLNEWGFYDYYIPVEHGGKLASFEQLLGLVRVITRRDFTVAVAHVKTYLGAVAVWLAGSARQRERLARLIKRGKQVSLALTERAHGSDILSSETVAEADGGGHVLTGEKWLINNATRAAALTVFAKSGGAAAAGPRGFSMFLVEKSRLDASSYTHHPKIKTHGIRGADISGIRFKQCRLGPGALLGAPGSALEVMLKGFQITRVIVTGLSLGAADTALRTTTRFALSRRLYGGLVFDIPLTQRTMVDAYVRLLTCECTSIAAMRGLHVAPEQMSVWSAVAKYYVPATVEKVVAALAVVLGARHYLREGHDWGIFQKVLRDQAIAGLFDGNTVVNLNVIAQQQRSLAEHGRRRDAGEAEEADRRLEDLFSLGAALPAFEAGRQELFNRGRDDITQCVKGALARLESLGGEGKLDEGVLENVKRLAGELEREIGQLSATILRAPVTSGNTFNQSPDSFEQAERHCTLHAAAACLHMWLHNLDLLGGSFAAGTWLALALDACLRDLQPGRESSLPSAYTEIVARELVRQFREDQLFSILPLQLATVEPS
jgi:alkylation response protein AidB-like acyl-CoA dehydrogenase